MGGGSSQTQTQDTTTRVELDPNLTRAATATMGASLAAAGLPYAPNRGLTIAAFAPQELAAMQASNAAAQAFGLPTTDFSGYLPPAMMNENGYIGYSTGDLYDQNLMLSMSEEQRLERDRLLEQFRNIGNSILNSPAPSRRKSSGGSDLSAIARQASARTRANRDDGGNFNEGSWVNSTVNGGGSSASGGGK